MSEKTNDKAKETAKSAPAFSKQHILTFRRYAGRRDLLSVLLQEGQTYTMEQVDSLLQKFEGKKGKVK